MKSEILNKEAQTESPCLTCKYRDIEGNSCALLCLRLAAHSSGKPWKDQPLPYIAKKQIKKRGKALMEKTATENQRPEVGDPEDKPEKAKKDICVICLNPDKPILNKRSQTCRTCYQRWRKGVMVHPTLGKFVSTQPHYKSKTKTTATNKVKATQQPDNPVSRSYPFPDIVPLDFTNYPEIKKVIFERVDKFMLPAEHIIFSMLAGALAGKKED